MARSDYTGAPNVSAQVDAPNDYQHEEAGAGAFGGAIAQGGEAIGSGLLDTAKFYGTVAADNGTNNTLQQVTNILHGDPSKTVMGPDGQPVPDTGYFGKRGADAMRARPEVSQDIDDIIGQQRENLQSDPLALQQFENDTRRYRAQWLTQIGEHADQQQSIWAKNTNDTTAALAMNQIGRDPTNLNSVAQAQELVRKSYVRNAQINGENTDGAILKADQSVLLTRIHSLVVSQPQAAQQLMDQKGGLLASLPNYDQIARTVKEATINSQIAPATDAAISAAKLKAQSLVGNPANPNAPAPVIDEAKAAQTITSLFPGSQITSEARTPEHNAAVGGASDSMHLTGQATDFRAPAGTTLADVKAKLTESGFPATEVLQEIGGKATTEPVFHIGWRPKGNQSSQVYPSTADALRATQDQTLQDAQAQAEKMFPQYPDAQERYVQGVRRGLDQTISQQEQQYTIDTHVVQQALAPDNHVMSEQQLVAQGPQVANAWASVQANNPGYAISVERMFDANAKGPAPTYGLNFKTYLDRVLAPSDQTDRVSDTSALWQYVGSDKDAALTNTGVNQLNDLLAQRRTPAGEAFATQARTFSDSMYGQLTFTNKVSGVFDPNGEKRYANFMEQALPIMVNAQKNGNLAAVLNPKSPDYIGNLAQHFMRTPAQTMKDRLADHLPPMDYTILNQHLNTLPTDDLRKQELQQAVQSGKISLEDGARIAVERHYVAAPTKPDSGPQVPLPSDQ